VLAQADSTSWGAQVRQAAAEPDLARQRAALEQLAAAADVRRLPPRALTRLAQRLQSVQSYAAAVDLLQRAQRLYPGDFWINQDLGNALVDQKAVLPEEAARYLTAAVALRPESAGAQLNLGRALREQGKQDEAIAVFRQTLILEPKYAEAEDGLGVALSKQGKLDEAIAAYRRALALDPKYVAAYSNLGAVMFEQGKLTEAITAFRQALDLDSKYALGYLNLGVALAKQDKLDEAIVAFRRALALEPKDARAHYNLGVTLDKQGRREEAIAAYRQTLALDPKAALAHYNLGHALAVQDKLDEAIAAYRSAIELKPDYAEAHCNLGRVLLKQGHLAEALASRKRGHELGSKRADWKYASAEWVKETETLVRLESQLPAILRGDLKAVSADDLYAYGSYLGNRERWPEAAAVMRQVIRLQPDRADAHGRLTWYLERQDDLDGAIAAGREAIRLNPKISWYYNNLGYALRRQGHLREAVDEYRIALRLDPKNDKALVNLRDVEPFLQAEARLPLILKGDTRPADNAERLKLARVCHFKRMYHTALRFFTDALRKEPALTEKVEGWHRYDAACCAVLAGCGQGIDARPTARPAPVSGSRRLTGCGPT
jgi:superkiller protein 3